MSQKKYYAHTDPENPDKTPAEGARWHLLKDHLLETARLSEKFASEFGAGDWGQVAGLLHDLGKYSQEFQNKLLSTTNAHIEQTAHVDHSTYGAQYISGRWQKGEGKILAYLIAGHHSGLTDGKTNDDSCLHKRLNKELLYNFHQPEFEHNYEKPSLPFKPDNSRMTFELSFFIRMLYSCLVDADFLNTEKHMNSNQSTMRTTGYSPCDLQKIMEGYLKKFQEKCQKTKINQIRFKVLQNCLQAAENESGLFSLTVPTGGGKTLSSMAFALKHACKYDMNRIIYVIPYTSIIEQNAAVFRGIFGDDAILEHHSNYEPDEENYRTRLASENWDAPIIVTTNVQFYESLYANRSSQCRKLHSIANSVIILDEVQTLPNELLLPCIEVIRELALHYHCSIVLCSATQPAIKKRDDFLFGLENVREIVENPKELSTLMERVEVQSLQKQTNGAIIDRIKREKQVLCIVNTKPHAKKLYDCIIDLENTFHLSTLMCPVHRRQKFKKIRQYLNDNLPCRVISTQLIEAGVDIDFPVVFRSIAGIDSIAQAAGRCNREGYLESGKVYVFEPEDGLPPGYFRQTSQTAQSIIRRFPEILSLDAIEEYFKEFYWMKGMDELDKKGILQSLKEGIRWLDFSFKEISSKFKLIEKDTKPVIIPFEKEAQAIINQLPYMEYLRGVSRKLQKYTVQIHPFYWNMLYDLGKLEIIQEIFPVLTDMSIYDDNTGLNIYGLNDNPDPNELIC